MITGKNSSKNPCITFRAYRNKDYAVIEVTDNGPGIPEAIQGKIFDPFFTTKEIGVGTGLGLSVSYSIIRVKHNGSIKIKSEPESHTTFTINLPLQQTKAEKKL